MATTPVPLDGREVVLHGIFRRLHGDPCGWHYRLGGARVVSAATPRPRFGLSRRELVAATSLICLPAEVAAQTAPRPTG